MVVKLRRVGVGVGGVLGFSLWRLVGRFPLSRSHDLSTCTTLLKHGEGLSLSGPAPRPAHPSGGASVRHHYCFLTGIARVRRQKLSVF